MHRNLTLGSGVMGDMEAQRPTVLLVHGLCHTPAHFHLLRDLLSKSEGLPTVCPALPSVADCSAAAVGLYDDAAVVRRELDNLVSEGKDVIVVGHSLGGLVVRSACIPAIALATVVACPHLYDQQDLKH